MDSRKLPPIKYNQFSNCFVDANTNEIIGCTTDLQEIAKRANDAPELLEALDDVLVTYESQHDEDVLELIDWKAVRAAIAKAKG